MRTLASFLLVSTLVLGIHALASGEDEKDALQKRVELLELQAELLMEREAALSAYVLRNGARADALDKLVTKMRAEGFTKRAIPAASRESLLAGLSGLAKDLREEMPTPTKAQLALRGKIDAKKKK